jgi:hypothetical protein
MPQTRDWPTHWLRPESSAGLVRFVETRFDPETTQGEIRRLFGEVHNVSVNPMPLRAIFLSLARSRGAAA